MGIKKNLGHYALTKFFSGSLLFLGFPGGLEVLTFAREQMWLARGNSCSFSIPLLMYPRFWVN